MSYVKVFHRKTKKGSVMKIVREHYTRDDLHCGRESCTKCLPHKITPSQSQFAPPSYLEENARTNICSLYDGPHYLVPDYDVIVSQIDVLTDTAFGNNVIIMQTVLDELKRNIAIYSRVKELMCERKFYVFSNEYHEQTFRERDKGETIKEYKQNLIRAAVKWLNQHFDGEIKVFLLTNQVKEIIEDGGGDVTMNGSVPCWTFKEYVMNMKDNVNLLDKLVSVTSETTENNQAKFGYSEHLPSSVLQAGIKSGKYIQGKFTGNRSNYLEGFVNMNLNGEEVRVLIQGRECINRAVHEDVVAVELLPQSEWTRNSDVVLVVDEDVDEVEEEEKLKDEKDMKLEKKDLKKDLPPVRPCGKVVGIVKRNWRQYCGVLKERNKHINNSAILTQFLFVPSDKRIPIIRIETRQYDMLKGQRIIVTIDSWPKDSRYPKGHYVRSLGNAGDKETEYQVLLLEHDVPNLDFSKAVLNCLPKEQDNWKIPENEAKLRLDLRNECVCSIDPPGCTDIDDALHCKDLGDGIYEIGVHIADVSFFVKPNTAIDKEASNRGTTVYLVDRRIDMIPTLLSSNLCSLKHDQERLTFSVIWKLNSKTAEIKSTTFAKSMILSKAAMTYAEAQGRIDSPHDNSEIAKSLRRLNHIAKLLNKKRIENGALVLASASEIKFVEVESETHDNVVEVEAKQMLETNSLVEEFMLLANISVAEKTYKELQEFALLRRHPQPAPGDFEELVKSGKNRGLNISVSDGKDLSESLNSANDPNNPYVNLMLRMITTRCMTQALYFCSGSITDSLDTFKHFGLACPIYTHFTSPIRRYADLMVHRLLSHIIEYEAIDASLLSKHKMQSLCEHINYRHRMAQYANRAASHLHTILYIKSFDESKPLIEDGYILHVRKNAFIIFIPRLALEVTYFFEPPDDWNYNETTSSQEHIPTKTIFTQFAKVSVQLGIAKQVENRGNTRLQVKLVKPLIDCDQMMTESTIDAVEKNESNQRRKKIKT